MHKIAHIIYQIAILSKDLPGIFMTLTPGISFQKYPKNRWQMFIKDLAKCDYLKASDGTSLCELLHPGRDGQDIPYSIAHALLEPGESSLPHRLKTSSEVYFILEGEGEMHIDSAQAEVGTGQAILIPPGSWQHIRNIGRVDLKFLCIVHPMWRIEDEERQ